MGRPLAAGRVVVPLIGLHPGGGHTWRLRSIVGRQTTMAMVLFGEALDGARAADVGLAWRCVPDDELLDTCVALATRAASYPAKLQRSTKTAMLQLPNIDTSADAVEHEVVPQVHSMGSPEFQELVSRLRVQISSSD